METDVNYTVVGAFVMGLTLALVVIAFWLSVGLEGGGYHTYLAYMNESVAGLSEDSVVKYNGVNIGKVRKISLNPNNLKQVRLLLVIEPNVPIKTDTVATLISQGLTGISYINLSGGSKAAPLLVARHGEHYPVIRTEPSLYFRLDNTVRELAQSVNTVTQDIHATLNKENQLALKNTLKNLNTITTSIAASSAELEAGIKRIDIVLRDGQIAIQTFSNQVAPQAQRTLSQVQSLATHLNNVAIDLEKNPSILIRGREPAKPGPGE